MGKVKEMLMEQEEQQQQELNEYDEMKKSVEKLKKQHATLQKKLHTGCDGVAIVARSKTFFDALCKGCSKWRKGGWFAI
eukprot:SAG31_NODE_8146_length_1511_cov_1.299575_2_plen_79_part_00